MTTTNLIAALSTALTAALTLTCTVARADVGARKEPLRVDFNQMIEEGMQNGRELQRGVIQATSASSEAKAQPTKSEGVSATAQVNPADARRNVIDFIDMEVGVGSDASVVDRR